MNLELADLREKYPEPWSANHGSLVLTSGAKVFRHIVGERQNHES